MTNEEKLFSCFFYHTNESKQHTTKHEAITDKHGNMTAKLDWLKRCYRFKKQTTSRGVIYWNNTHDVLKNITYPTLFFSLVWERPHCILIFYNKSKNETLRFKTFVFLKIINFLCELWIFSMILEFQRVFIYNTLN
jgi:hypothetical protein